MDKISKVTLGTSNLLLVQVMNTLKFPTITPEYFRNCNIFNPWCMHHRVTVVCLCVCVSVCYHKIFYIPCLYVENKVSQDSLQCFQGFCRVAFIEMLRSRVMASFSGHCCLPHSPTMSRWTKKTATTFRHKEYACLAIAQRTRQTCQ